MASQTGNETDILNAITQIVNNCVHADGFDVTKLASFDIEYIFLKIRAKSVDNVVELAFRDNEDEKIYNFKVNLDKIEITFNEKNNPKIEINDEAGIIMRYPDARIAERIGIVVPAELTKFKMIRLCIDKIYDADNVYNASEFSDAELEEFVDNLDMTTYNKIDEFFDTIPKLYHKIEYKNSLNNDRVIELTTLTDFFSLV